MIRYYSSSLAFPRVCHTQKGEKHEIKKLASKSKMVGGFTHAWVNMFPHVQG